MNKGGSREMRSKCIDLKDEINAKKEELNSLVENGIGKDTLKTSRELDDLIVQYMNEQLSK